MKHWQLGVLSIVVLSVASCAQKQPQPTAHSEQTPPPLAQMDKTPPAVADPYATDPYATDPLVRPQDTGKPLAAEKETTLVAGKEASGARTHIVQKGDTLYKLARQYYNDQGRWKDIWEANRARVPDKDKLEVGTKLIIP
jgi:nucleoid-associated protein YgaU